MGGFGLTDEYPVSRFYRGARYGTIGGTLRGVAHDLMWQRRSSGLDVSQGILGLGTY